MNSRHRLIVIAAPTLVIALGAGVAILHAAQQQEAAAAQEAPQMPPAPGEHHKWLQQLVGTWTVESEMAPPGAPAMKATGTDTVRSIGGRWIISELKSDVPGMGMMHAVSTLGYDPVKGKYQGTWVDSILDHIWIYSGTLDATPALGDIVTSSKSRTRTTARSHPTALPTASGCSSPRRTIAGPSESPRAGPSCQRIRR